MPNPYEPREQLDLVDNHEFVAIDAFGWPKFWGDSGLDKIPVSCPAWKQNVSHDPEEGVAVVHLVMPAVHLGWAGTPTQRVDDPAVFGQPADLLQHTRIATNPRVG